MNLTVVLTQTSEVPAASCSGNRCDSTFAPGQGYVPDVITLYEQVRDSRLNAHHPLNRAEILSMEYCRPCGRDRRFEKYGITMFPTVNTLLLMQQWAAKNAENMEISQHQRDQWEVRERARRLKDALRKPDDKGFVNQMFADTKIQVDKPNPKRRTHRRAPPIDRRGRKKYGDEPDYDSETDTPGMGRSKKGKNLTKGGKGKGR